MTITNESMLSEINYILRNYEIDDNVLAEFLDKLYEYVVESEEKK
jgi:hypothetical protein|tara:strand:- start:124 stop:258 length:135 start_codon:yes stop_codon:yes gene_type:complete